MSKKVFLSAGHGGSDPGASAYGLIEKDINLNILMACKNELENHGIKVVCSRMKDEYDPVNQEVIEANASGADIAVSFHTNAGGGDGSETFYYPGSKDGETLARLCEKHTMAIGQNSRGIKNGKKLRFINATTMTAVLCECAFVDHDADNNVIDTKTEQIQFGIAYAKAILEFFGIAYKGSTTQNNTTNESKTDDSFIVKVTIDNLNIRTGAGTNYVRKGVIKPGTYTIVAVKSGKGSDKGWGKLKSGVGWISLDYVTRV